MQLVQPHKWVPSASINGMHQSFVTWAAYTPPRHSNGDNTLLHCSLVGGYTRLKAFWAALMDGRRQQIVLPGTYHYERVLARRIEGPNQYRVAWNTTELPTSGLAHLDITARTLTETTPNDAGALHLLPKNGMPDYTLFFRQLDAMISLPLREEWAQDLWGNGLYTGVVEKLSTLNCEGYYIKKDERAWAKIAVALNLGIRPHNLDTSKISVESFGQAKQVETVANENDSDDAAWESEDEG